MNKRLEQEFNNFIDRLAIKESLAEGVHPSMFDLQRVAEHFYNLALADVREELEVQDEKYRTMRVSKESTTQHAREADLVVYVLHGLNNFVDRLNK